MRDGIRTSFGVKMPPPKFIVDGDAPPNVLVVTLGGEPTDDRPIPVDLEGDCVKNAMSAIAIRLGSARPFGSQTIISTMPRVRSEVLGKSGCVVVTD